MTDYPDVVAYDIDWEYDGYDEALSVHVLETADATVLFGAGDQSIADRIVDIVTDHAVDVVVIEHGHIDHYGGAAAVRAETDAAIAIPRGDAAVLERIGVDPDYRLDAGETDWGVEPIAAPGHTVDNMAYRVGDVLIAGDTVVGSDSQFAASESWSGPLAMIESRFNTDDAQARASVQGLLEYDFDVVCTSHGSNVETDGAAAVERLVADLA
jgi:glyoxylase-like metal-dependent hydrolase (beta-lactamase superfamily II)